jgi:hypothetical protein
MSLEQQDAEVAKVSTHPRVTLADIEAAIAEKYFVSGEYAVGDNLKGRAQPGEPRTSAHPLSLLTMCFLVLHNGFTIVGKSAPASPENFDPELGKKIAYDDARNQMWPLMGFALKDRLASCTNVIG